MEIERFFDLPELSFASVFVGPFIGQRSDGSGNLDDEDDETSIITAG